MIHLFDSDSFLCVRCFSSSGFLFDYLVSVLHT